MRYQILALTALVLSAATATAERPRQAPMPPQAPPMKAEFCDCLPSVTTSYVPPKAAVKAALSHAGYTWTHNGVQYVPEGSGWQQDATTGYWFREAPAQFTTPGRMLPTYGGMSFPLRGAAVCGPSG